MRMIVHSQVKNHWLFHSGTHITLWNTFPSIININSNTNVLIFLTRWSTLTDLQWIRATAVTTPTTWDPTATSSTTKWVSATPPRRPGARTTTSSAPVPSRQRTKHRMPTSACSKPHKYLIFQTPAIATLHLKNMVLIWCNGASSSPLGYNCI